MYRIKTENIQNSISYMNFIHLLKGKINDVTK